MANHISYKDILEHGLKENNSANIPVGGIEPQQRAHSPSRRGGTAGLESEYKNKIKNPYDRRFPVPPGRDCRVLQFESEDERSRYLISVFPGLVKEGKFVRAMELVHGNGSFNWFYGLFDKFSRWLIKKTLQKRAGKEQTVHERILDQAA